MNASAFCPQTTENSHRTLYVLGKRSLERLPMSSGVHNSPPTGSAASTQFTSSVLATVASLCDRSRCGKTIEPGQHRYYFANVIDDHPGKWVCGQCYNYYLSKAATTTARQPQDNATSGQAKILPDSAAIRRDVNESQRQGMLESDDIPDRR